MEPISCAIQADDRSRPGEIPELLRKSSVLKFVPKLDALIDLLAETTDGLAATKDLMEDRTGPGVRPTVQ